MSVDNQWGAGYVPDWYYHWMREQNGQLSVTEKQNADQYERMRQVLKGYLAAQANPVELPDEFADWVEEVRRQNRLEELVKVIYAKIIPEEEKEAKLWG